MKRGNPFANKADREAKAEHESKSFERNEEKSPKKGKKGKKAY